MVGVGGRSKACDQCRRRRVKCDFTYPTCHKCQKSSLKCGGYRGLRIIQYEGVKAITKASPMQTTGGGKGNLIRRSCREVTPERLSAAAISIPCDDVFLNYARARLLRGPDAEEVPKAGVDSRLSDGSFLALATILFGAEQRSGMLVQRGLQRYSATLEKLNEALCDKKRQHSLDVLGAVMIMSMFEYLVSARERGWINHAWGLEKLMELRGPLAFISLPELMIFERTRATLILAALVRRRPTILAQREWKIVPWTLYEDRKTAMQMLYDIFADCPALIATKEGLEKKPMSDETFSEYQMLGTKIEDLLNHLRKFQMDWDSSYQHCCWEVPSPATTPTIPTSTEDSEEPVPLWPTVLHYQSLYHANVVILRAAIHIFLSKLSQNSFLSTFTCTPGVSDEVELAGFTICRSVDYYLQEIRGGAFSHLLFWPLKMAFASVEETHPAVGVWLKELLIQFSSGLSGRWNNKASFFGR